MKASGRFNSIQLTTVLIGICMILLHAAEAFAQSPEPDYGNIVFATVGDKSLALDIYLPDGVENPPLLVWVHGGAWRSGSRVEVPPVFVGGGFAVTSVDYRLSPEAQFPAQIHDIKAAIRFLRANGDKYGFSTDQIAISGSSAGAHLAALVGVTNGHSELEGTVGEYQDASSDVQAIVSYFGASNLMSILGQSTPHGLSVRKPALDLFIGGQPDVVTDVARLASPVFHVDAGDPPLLLLHGDQDPQMPINQSHELEGIYKQYGLDVSFDVVHGAAHGGPAFYDGEHLENALVFLERTIGK
jgi:acetyl esterase/lipase